MWFKELLGLVVLKIGMIMLKAGAIVANAGFDLTGVSRERAVAFMSNMWQEDMRKGSQITTSDILDKEHYGAFVRAEETGDKHDLRSL